MAIVRFVIETLKGLPQSFQNHMVVFLIAMALMVTLAVYHMKGSRSMIQAVRNPKLKKMIYAGEVICSLALVLGGVVFNGASVIAGQKPEVLSRRFFLELIGVAVIYIIVYWVSAAGIEWEWDKKKAGGRLSEEDNDKYEDRVNEQERAAIRGIALASISAIGAITGTQLISAGPVLLGRPLGEWAFSLYAGWAIALLIFFAVSMIELLIITLTGNRNKVFMDDEADESEDEDETDENDGTDDSDESEETDGNGTADGNGKDDGDEGDYSWDSLLRFYEERHGDGSGAGRQNAGGAASDSRSGSGREQRRRKKRRRTLVACLCAVAVTAVAGVSLFFYLSGRDKDEPGTTLQTAGQDRGNDAAGSKTQPSGSGKGTGSTAQPSGAGQGAGPAAQPSGAGQGTDAANSTAPAVNLKTQKLTGRESVKKLTTLAEAGNVDAQARLAYQYRFGIDTATNKELALHWYLEAAEAGNADAQRQAGFMYVSGEGTGVNYEEALKWTSRAADQGNVYSFQDMGYYYLKGIGVQKDLVQARQWYEKAVDGGYIGACHEIGMIYLYPGDHTEPDTAKAAEWFARGAEGGDRYSAYELGTMYENGNGVEQNYETAAGLYLQAAQGDGGYSGAQYRLGILYEKGLGVEKNAEQAMFWYKAAADQGHSQAKSSYQRLGGGQE